MELLTFVLLVLSALGIRHVVAKKNLVVKTLEIIPPETDNPPEEDSNFNASKFLVTDNKDLKQGNFVVSRL
jgi:hypothetical protein